MQENGDDSDRTVRRLQHTYAIFGRERLLELAAAVKHAKDGDTFIAASGVARGLADETLAVSKTQRALVIRLEFETNAAERQVRDTTRSFGMLVQPRTDVRALTQISAKPGMERPLIERLWKEVILNSLTGEIAQCGGKREGVGDVLVRDQRPLPQHIADLKKPPVDALITGNRPVDAVNAQVAMADDRDGLFDPFWLEIGRISELKGLRAQAL